MRVVWKDSGTINGYKPVKYRNHFVYGTPNGWTTSVPGDPYVYKTHYCALNAIDKALDGTDGKGCSKRQRYGITIIGQKDDTA